MLPRAPDFQFLRESFADAIVREELESQDYDPQQKKALIEEIQGYTLRYLAIAKESWEQRKAS